MILEKKRNTRNYELPAAQTYALELCRSVQVKDLNTGDMQERLSSSRLFFFLGCAVKNAIKVLREFIESELRQITNGYRELQS